MTGSGHEERFPRPHASAGSEKRRRGMTRNGRGAPKLKFEPTTAEAVPPHLGDTSRCRRFTRPKAREWNAVFVLNVIDGCIPSDMAVGSREQTEEERRLMYVAMTRAREHLRLVHPLRLYRSDQHRYGDGHVLAQRTQLHSRQHSRSFRAPSPGSGRSNW
jgi:ATP-dependent DNA helicase UvrD/PcrA